VKHFHLTTGDSPIE